MWLYRCIISISHLKNNSKKLKKSVDFIYTGVYNKYRS
nr:MAG TPA: hypothetical protein [Caudoviricetes sp.]